MVKKGKGKGKGYSLVFPEVKGKVMRLVVNGDFFIWLDESIEPSRYAHEIPYFVDDD